MIERIYIKDLLERLNCKDVRSIKRWCVKNGVAILSDIGSNKKYVIKAEFEAKYMSQSIKYITEKYGKDKLSQFLNSSMKFFAEYNQVKKEKKYKPQGEYEMNFLSVLTNIKPTL